jgi:hypothetical protein
LPQKNSKYFCQNGSKPRKTKNMKNIQWEPSNKDQDSDDISWNKKRRKNGKKSLNNNQDSNIDYYQLIIMI